MKTKLIVSNGQYEKEAFTVTVNHKTWKGLCRRITQLENENAVYGDNWIGWIKARVALASDHDKWGNNNIIGGQWCNPNNGWLTIDSDSDSDSGPFEMSYDELYNILYGKGNIL